MKNIQKELGLESQINPDLKIDLWDNPNSTVKDLRNFITLLDVAGLTPFVASITHDEDHNMFFYEIVEDMPEWLEHRLMDRIDEVCKLTLFCFEGRDGIDYRKGCGPDED